MGMRLINCVDCAKQCIIWQGWEGGAHRNGSSAGDTLPLRSPTRSQDSLVNCVLLFLLSAQEVPQSVL